MGTGTVLSFLPLLVRQNHAEHQAIYHHVGQGLLKTSVTAVLICTTQLKWFMNIHELFMNVRELFS